MSKIGMQELIGHVLGGRYRLTRIVGTGASGVVYSADDVRLKRRVAVKVLHKEYLEDQNFLKRFRGEAQLAASLHHPNIVSVYDWGEDDFPYLVLELLEGGSLRSQLDEDILLSPSQAAHIGIQVCSALEHAHTRGIIHRDIKPANLLFDEHGIVRVADFGLARALAEGSMTERSGTILGTTRYASPELANGKILDNRSDIYSFALVLMEATTGELPFIADTQLGTLTARLQEGISAPSELGALAAVLERAGKLDPKDRYQDARTMKMALQDVARSLPRPGPLTLVTIEGGSQDPHPTTMISDSIPTVDDKKVETTVEKESKTLSTDSDISEKFQDSSKNQKVVGLTILVSILIAIIAATLMITKSGDSNKLNLNYIGQIESVALKKAKSSGVKLEIKKVLSTDPVGVVIEQDPLPGVTLTGDSVEIKISNGPKPIKIPKVVTLKEANAEEILVNSGFLVVKKRVYDSKIAKGIVISTNPAQDSKAPPETSIEIVISDGPPPVPVPDISNKTYSEGVNALSAVNLKSVRVEEFSDTVSAGIILRTDPAVGKKAPYGSTVKIIVSKGPEIINVPNLVGMSVESATSKLKALGFKVDVQNYSAGAVVRAQDPTAGAAARKGSQVTLFL